MTEADKVLKARNPEDLFGPIGDDRDLWLERAKARYRKYSRVLHPDKPTGNEEAFKALNTLWVAAQSDRPRDTGRETVILARKNAYTVTADAARWSGTIADVIPVTFGDPEHVGVLKVARSPKNNDLLDNQWRALQKMTEDPDDRRTNFIPRPIELFTLKEGAKQRRVNALSWPSEVGDASHWWSLQEIRDAQGVGLHPRDAAWIFKRLLVALELAESNGYVHANVTPAHILIHPELHALMLVGWSGATKGGEEAKVIDPRYKWMYHKDVVDKKPIDTYVDLAMAATTMLATSDVVGRFKTFLQALTRGVIKDVDVVRVAFNDLLYDVFGAPKFHPMVSPTERRA